MLFLGADAWDNPDLLMNEELTLKAASSVDIFHRQPINRAEKPSLKPINLYMEKRRSADRQSVTTQQNCSSPPIARAGSLMARQSEDQLAATKTTSAQLTIAKL